MAELPLLTLVTFAPLLGLVILLFVRGEKVSLIRGLGILFSLISFVLSVLILLAHTSANPGFQLVESIPWITVPGTDIQIMYHMGVDGISVPMVVLTGLLSFLAAIASWNITDRAKEYWIFYLLLQVGMFGTFVALDLFLFYVFWELVLVPMYFLIGIWGGPRREYAALKFFLYTLVGSVIMLIGFLALYIQCGTFQIPTLIEVAPGILDPRMQMLLFFALFLGFAVKVPVWPFHTWLPDAHVEAPTPISAILAGVLLKMGTYGFFRFNFPLFPDAIQTGWVRLLFAGLGVIAIVYAAYVAFAQRDFKKLVAYSSVSHMGFVLLGMASLTLWGMSGAYFQTFSHGILSAAMFLLVGVLYDRAHTRDLDGFGGLLATMPIYGGILIFFALGSLGLPGLSGFIAEFSVLFGAWGYKWWLVVIAGVGVVMTAAYTLTMVRKVLYGPLNEKWAKLPEINGREIGMLIPLGVVTLCLGLFPMALMNITDPSIEAMLQDMPEAQINLPSAPISEEAIEAFHATQEHHGEAATDVEGHATEEGDAAHAEEPPPEH